MDATYSTLVVMTYNMNIHSNLLLHAHVDAILQQSTLSIPIDKFTEVGFFSSELYM
jgi:hypothetical protein